MGETTRAMRTLARVSAFLGEADSSARVYSFFARVVSARPSVSLPGRGGLHSSRELLIRTSGLSSPECQPSWARRTSQLACTPCSRERSQLARVSAFLGEADSTARGSHGNPHTRSAHVSSPKCQPSWARRTPQLACTPCSCEGSQLTRVSAFLGEADSTARVYSLFARAVSARLSVSLSERSELLSSCSSHAHAVVVACEAHLSARVTISIIVRRTTQLARVSAPLCEADSFARPVMSAYKACTRTPTKLTRELCSRISFEAGGQEGPGGLEDIKKSKIR
ncbi:hypothetical protein ACLB2K_052274 [Fragaria x ananassa]